MITLWWPALLVPAYMVLCSVAKRRLPWNYYHAGIGMLTEEEQQAADEMLYQMLLRFSAVFACIAVMTMYTVRLLPQRTQLIVEYFVIMAQVVGILLLAVPIRRTLTARFGQQDNEGEDE